MNPSYVRTNEGRRHRTDIVQTHSLMATTWTRSSRSALRNTIRPIRPGGAMGCQKLAIDIMTRGTTHQNCRRQRSDAEKRYQSNDSRGQIKSAKPVDADFDDLRATQKEKRGKNQRSSSVCSNVAGIEAYHSDCLWKEGWVRWVGKDLRERQGPSWVTHLYTKFRLSLIGPFGLEIQAVISRSVPNSPAPAASRHSPGLNGMQRV